MNFIGLDLSLTATGCAIKTPNKLELMTIGTEKKDFKTPEARYCEIFSTIFKIIEPYLIDSLRIVIEDFYIPFTAKHFGSAIKLIALGTMVRYGFQQHCVPYWIVTNGAIKKFTTGKGNAPKDIMLKEVFRRWGVDTSDNNQADAAAMAFFADAFYRFKNNISIDDLKLTKPMKDALIEYDKETTKAEKKKDEE